MNTSMGESPTLLRLLCRSVRSRMLPFLEKKIPGCSLRTVVVTDNLSMIDCCDVICSFHEAQDFDFSFSARNGQLCGRQKDFPETLINKIISLADVDFTEGNRDLDLLRLARFSEILYFISKNREFYLCCTLCDFEKSQLDHNVPHHSPAV